MAQSAKRVKIRRKDLRGPDEFETLTGETLAWAQGHRTPLIVAGTGVSARSPAATTAATSGHHATPRTA